MKEGRDVPKREGLCSSKPFCRLVVNSMRAIADFRSVVRGS